MPRKFKLIFTGPAEEGGLGGYSPPTFLQSNEKENLNCLLVLTLGFYDTIMPTFTTKITKSLKSALFLKEIFPAAIGERKLPWGPPPNNL
jgi:hypothetical protein